MATHYVCTGECGGVSPVAKVCEAEVCSKKGEPLMPCDCTDGVHAEIKSEAGAEGVSTEPPRE